LRLHQRREAHRQVGLKPLRQGKQRRIPPDICGTGGDRLTRKHTARRLQVVGHFEGSKAVRAGRQRLISETLTALVALQLIRRRGTGIAQYALSSVEEGKDL